MYKLPMSYEPVLKSLNNNYNPDHPVIYNGNFNLSKTGDTF